MEASAARPARRRPFGGREKREPFTRFSIAGTAEGSPNAPSARITCSITDWSRGGQSAAEGGGAKRWPERDREPLFHPLEKAEGKGARRGLPTSA
jgi:hypothetical protein